ncbi:hypothetical protein WCLP8_2010006 [uncultured Gammaproteobacteria bacterium]
MKQGKREKSRLPEGYAQLKEILGAGRG